MFAPLDRMCRAKQRVVCSTTSCHYHHRHHRPSKSTRERQNLGDKCTRTSFVGLFGWGRWELAPIPSDRDVLLKSLCSAVTIRTQQGTRGTGTRRCPLCLRAGTRRCPLCLRGGAAPDDARCACVGVGQHKGRAHRFRQPATAEYPGRWVVEGVSVAIHDSGNCTWSAWSTAA